MLYTTTKKKLEFRAKMDPWGDEYTNDATEQSLQEVNISNAKEKPTTIDSHRWAQGLSTDAKPSWRSGESAPIG